MPEVSYYPPGFIKDGRINEVIGLHGSMRFKFKPMRVVKRDECYVTIRENRDKPEVYNAFVALAVAESLTTWDVKDEGKPVPITARNILDGLPSAQFDKLYEIVNGTRPSDPDMDGSPQRNADWRGSLLQSIANGTAFADEQEARVTGNSSPG